MAKAGVLVRVSREHFLLEESVRRYCEHIRQKAAQPEPMQGEQPSASEVGNSATTTTTEMIG
jgi:hypothetical protein